MRTSATTRRAFGSGACACLLLGGAALAGGLFLASLGSVSNEATVRVGGITPEIIYVRPDAHGTAGAEASANAAESGFADLTLSLAALRDGAAAENDMSIDSGDGDFELTRFAPAFGPPHWSSLRIGPDSGLSSNFVAIAASKFAPAAGGVAWDAVSLPHVPEPSTWALLVCGIGALTLAARRRLRA